MWYELIARDDFAAGEVGYRHDQDGSARRLPTPPGNVTYLKALTSVNAGGIGRFVEVGNGGKSQRGPKIET
jgi:hypothetical protein